MKKHREKVGPRPRSFWAEPTLRTRESAGGPGGLAVPWLGVAPCGRATGASRACWRWGHPPPRRRPNRVPGANGPQRAVLDAEQDVVTPALVVVTLGAGLVLALPAAWVVDVYSEYFSSVLDLQVRRYNSLDDTFGETASTKDFREEDFSRVPRAQYFSVDELLVFSEEASPCVSATIRANVAVVEARVPHHAHEPRAVAVVEGLTGLLGREAAYPAEHCQSAILA